MDVNIASKQEMLDYAKEEGLKVDGRIGVNELRDLIAKQLGQTVVQGNDEESVILAREQQAQRKQKRVKIRIAQNKEYPPRIPVIANGVTYSIVPGAVVEVPEIVVSILRDAKRVVISQSRGNDGRYFNTQGIEQQFNFEVLA